MPFKLEAVLSALGVLTAVAYTLGWLQAFYYFDTFGIRLASVEMSPQDYLLNSWFVVENVLFLLVLIWAIVMRRRWWTGLIGVLYFMIPIAAHYAFFWPDSWLANILIEYRHTLLKFIPFGLLLFVGLLDWWWDRQSFGDVLNAQWQYGRGALTLLVIIVASWSVSMAKHFGSFDANFELRYPARMLAKVRVHASPDTPDLAQFANMEALYLVHATTTQLFVWNSAGFVFKPGQKVDMYVIGRDKIRWLEITKDFQVQRGSLIL